MKYMVVILVLLNFNCVNLFSQKTYLTQNWVFTQQHKDDWYPAIIPGCVHTDLQKNSLIDNPYYGTNEKTVQWVNNTNFTYSNVFDIPQSMLQQQHIELVFEGLDTYAAVYINGHFLGNTNNMFRQWKFDIKPFAKYTKNNIRIEFTAAQTVVDSLAKSSTVTIPDNNRAFARKAQYQFGWDFAPKLTTCGIWKPVYINVWNNYHLSNLIPKVLEVNNTTLQSHIEITSIIESDSIQTVPYLLSYTLDAKNETTKFIVIDKLLQKGTNIITDELRIDNSKLWFPNGQGTANLYNITVGINDQQYTKAIGLRNIALITKPDSISDFKELQNLKGSGFYFNVNGKPTYINGANYVPMDMFPSTVTKERYEGLISAAKAANINMLRIWGGGIYEDDYFYELCNKAGIMIWQDFMFACSMIPTDTAFYSNVQQEATEQVQRLQHNPCIALWCGNNEIDEAWNNWGWQKQYNFTTSQSALLWDTYNNVFNKLLPSIVQKNTTNSNYWQSSPSIGWGRKESLTIGDCHYWGVWWGLQPIKTYQKKVPRFMSEYGMQSMPSMYTIKQFSTITDWDTASAVMKAHQKHLTGFENLAVYLKQEKFKPQKTFEQYVMYTQELQAKAYSIAINAHQKAKPYNMGTMLWQLNDPWPGISWSIIDYYGQKKKAYYIVQKLYGQKLK